MALFGAARDSGVNRTLPSPTRVVLGEVSSLPTFGGGGLGSSSHPRGAGRNPSPCLPVCAHFLCPQGEMTQPLPYPHSGGSTGGSKDRAIRCVVSWDASVVEPGI